jgi:hypothetical protein
VILKKYFSVAFAECGLGVDALAAAGTSAATRPLKRSTTVFGVRAFDLLLRAINSTLDPRLPADRAADLVLGKGPAVAVDDGLDHADVEPAGVRVGLGDREHPKLGVKRQRIAN